MKHKFKIGDKIIKNNNITNSNSTINITDIPWITIYTIVDSGISCYEKFSIYTYFIDNRTQNSELVDNEFDLYDIAQFRKRKIKKLLLNINI